MTNNKDNNKEIQRDYYVNKQALTAMIVLIVLIVAGVLYLGITLLDYYAKKNYLKQPSLEKPAPNILREDTKEDANKEVVNDIEDKETKTESFIEEESQKKGNTFHEIKMYDRVVVPKELYVTVGDTVVFRNYGNNLKVLRFDNEFEITKKIYSNTTFNYTVNKTGTIFWRDVFNYEIRGTIFSKEKNLVTGGVIGYWEDTGKFLLIPAIIVLVCLIFILQVHLKKLHLN